MGRAFAGGGEFVALGALAPGAFNTRVTGCSVGNLAWLAEGVFDAVVEFDDHVWDYAAGAAILLAAGGRISAPDGGPFACGGRSYVASNGAVHEELLQRLAARVPAPAAAKA